MPVVAGEKRASVYAAVQVVSSWHKKRKTRNFHKGHASIIGGASRPEENNVVANCTTYMLKSPALFRRFPVMTAGKCNNKLSTAVPILY